MFYQAFTSFPREIQPRKTRILLLQLLDGAQAMPIMLESTLPFHQPVEHSFALMPERRVAQVMSQRNRLSQIFVQLQSSADVTRDRRNFHCMGEPRAQVIACPIEKDLRLVFKPAKG